MRALVLFSGGQDSTTCLLLAVSRHGKDNVTALSVNYGQRHASELVAGGAIAAALGVRRVCVAIPDLGAALAPASALVSTDPIMADGGYHDDANGGSLPTSFVPGRNAIFLSIASGIAVASGAKEVWSGVCQADYSGYPDCRQEFVTSMERAMNLALPSSTPVRFVTPLMDLSKADTVRMAQQLGGLPIIGMTVTCYHGQRPGCGLCPACTVRARGFAEAGIPDPAK